MTVDNLSLFFGTPILQETLDSHQYFDIIK